MQSSDREILISISNRIMRLESAISEIRAEQATIKQDILLTQIKVEDLQTSVYWFFAAIAIIAALLALIPVFARKSEPQSPVQPVIVPSQPNIIFTDIVTLKDEIKKGTQKP